MVARLLLSLMLLTLSVALLSVPQAEAEPTLGSFDCSPPNQTQIPQSECDALVAFYLSTNGAEWENRTGWLTTATPCTWFGITCAGGHVIKIVMDDNQVSGPLPPALGNLVKLRDLHLYNNQLSGSIPPELGTLSNLLALDLHSNQLSGAIPSVLGSLSNLFSLDLYDNQLSGDIPDELGSLGELRYLNLHNNQLSGTIPPTLGSLGDLLALDLYDNQLSGDIPDELGSLGELRYLNLHNNQLSGAIPPALGSLGDLLALDLYDNQLSGDIPDELGSLGELRYLNLHNNLLSGSIPRQLGTLSDLLALDLHRNQLSDAIPSELGALDNLKYLGLQGNQFTGSLPAHTCEVDEYQIGYNRFTSAAPCVAPTWIDTQTIPPSNVAATPLPPSSVRLTWTAIPYTGDGGHYEVLGSATPGGPYQSLGQTASKQEAELTLQGAPLPPGGNYCFVVRTITLPHSANQNTLTSEPSAEVCVNLPDPGSDIALLALYALAFDTPPEHDLSWGYQAAMQGLQAASAEAANKTVVALVDLPGADNTFIYTFRGGEATLHTELPNAAGNPTPGLREYDMTDGATLGGFLLWARAAHPTDGPTTFSYVGHGGPLIPDTDFEAIFGDEGEPRGLGSPLFPLPVRVDANPQFTDITPHRKLLSVYQLSEALRIGSQSGSDPFAVVDMVKCFAGALEELYALAPYATTLTSSPNYTYFAPEMLGAGLAALNPDAPPEELATSLIARYDSVIASHDDPETPTDDHPRLLIAVASAELPGLKEAWDEVAFRLMENFDRARLESAYRQSAFYDTTYCQPQDWTLAPPDALVDLDTFAERLATLFGDPVQVPANTLRVRLGKAVLARHQQSGTPWFAENQPTWDFANRSGISLYADLLGTEVGTERQVSWHAHFYTDTVSVANPHPYTFVQGGFQGVGWADVFHRFWQDASVSLQTAACLPALPPPLDTGELSVTALPLPRPATVTEGAPVHLVARVDTSQLVVNPTIAFTVTQRGAVVFTNRVQLAHLVTGTHPIAASRAWIPELTPPNASEPFTVEVVIDPENRVVEQDESNNRFTLSDVVGSAALRPRPILSATMANGLQWLRGPTATLNVAQDPSTTTSPVRMVEVQVYQYEAERDPSVHLPTLRGSVRLFDVNLANPLTFTLPHTTRTGAGVMVVWGWSAGGVSIWNPSAVVPFNYTPPQTPIEANQSHYFRFHANAQDTVEIGLDVPIGQDANLFAWDPYTFGPPHPIWGSATAPGDDTILIQPAPFDGSYLLAVRGESDTPYTLTVSRNGMPGQLTPPAPTLGIQGGISIPAHRPTFVEPIPLIPGELFLPLIGR